MKRLIDTRAGSAAMRDTEALGTVVAVCRRFTTVLPGGDRVLANTLRHMARALIARERTAEALVAVEESVRICRQRVAARPVRYGCELVWSLMVQARALEHLGCAEQALAAAEESVVLCRRMVETAPAVFGPALLAALRVRASALYEVGRMNEAITDAELVVRYARRLVARRSGQENDLSTALHLLGIFLVEADRLTDGLRAYDEAIQLCGPDPILLENRELCLRELEQAGMVVLGPYPLCSVCEQTNGGLVAVRHPQRHIEANGREACVDRPMADIVTTLWKAGCDTRSSCQDDDGEALVIPARGQAAKAVDVLAGIGIHARNDNGELHFPLA